MVKRIERVLRATDRFQQRHGMLGFPVAVIKKFGDDQAGKHAALLAYYGFLSLFPLLLVFVTVLGYAIANNPGLRQQLIDTVTTRFPGFGPQLQASRSEEHTSELQSRRDLVCRLLLEKKKRDE